METFPMGGTAEAHFSQQQQQPPPRQQQQQWPSQLLPPGQQPAPFPSPPASSISEHYPPPFYGSNSSSDRQGPGMPRNSQQLSLNMSGLNVAAPGALSPISASTSTAMSPATPISPAGNTHFSHPPQNMMFSSTSHSPYDTEPPSSATLPHLRHTTSRSSSVSSSSLPPSRKRSFTSINTQSSSASSAAPTSATLFEEVSPPYGDESRGSTPMDMGYDDGHHPSSTDVSTDEIETDGRRGSGKAHHSASARSAAPQNNFVSKLYAMITDPKAAQFIVWTELGTSFVVSNVGEFSRSVLGSHFKHNNFSSFVRQLNMYGFHKINRTPRAQRTSSDAQTWEFSHYKFLRGRPDLLDEIKRKALEPDPSVKQRIELPGEVAAQLGTMREENRRIWDQLSAEKRKVDKLVGVVARLWDVVDKGFGPGSVPSFPAELFDSLDSPNIYVTSPAMTSHHYPPPLNIPLNNVNGGLHSAGISPGVSPTTPEFANHQHPQSHMHQQPHPLSLSRRTSYTNMSSNGSGWRPNEPGASPVGNESPMEFFDDGAAGAGRVKRQRMSDEGVDMLNGSDSSASKRTSRSRSDSAPYVIGPGGGGGGGGWGMSRPRSGSGFQGQPPQQQQQQQRSLPPMSHVVTNGGGGGRMGPGQIAVPSNPPMIR